MHISEEDIKQLTASVWDSILQLPLDEIESAAERGTATMSAFVQITGAWTGSVSLTCEPAFARRAASIMFGLEQDIITRNELLDALGELVNMIGGNVKALLPQPCQLSLPTVIEGASFSVRVPWSEVLTSVALSCEGHRFTITLLREEAR